MTTLNTWGVLVWILLFLGGFILPTMTGIMLGAVSQNQRGSANSLAQLSNNLLGYLPAPYIYGILSTIGDTESGKKGNSFFSNRISMCAIVYMAILPCILVTCVLYRKK